MYYQKKTIHIEIYRFFDRTQKMKEDIYYRFIIIGKE